MSAKWLPPLLLLEDFNGNWPTYEAKVYSVFKRDFVHSLPTWPGKQVALKRQPISKGKEATYWHLTSEGKNEADRVPDLRRCERIGWARAVMREFQDRPPQAGDRIIWWKSERKGEWRYVLALPDFSYALILADRGTYVLPWTHYEVEPHRREKLRKEYEGYWASQNG